MSRRSRHRWRTLLLVALILLAAAFLLDRAWRHGFDWSLFGRTLAAVRWQWLAASAAVALLSYYGRVLRWAVLIRPICPHPSHWRLFSATAIGFTALVIFGRPGEFLRPYLIARKEGLPVSSQMAAWVLERIFDMFAILLVFAYTLTRLPDLSSVGPTLRWVLHFGGQFTALATALLLVLFIVITHYSDWALRRLLDALRFLPDARYRQASDIATAFVQGAQATRSWRATLLLLTYTALEWLLIVICYLFLFWSFPVIGHRSFGEVLSFLGFVSFGSIIQIPGVGGGVQVVSVLVLTELMNVPLEAAMGVALMIWLITFVVIVPVGLLLALHDGLTWGRFRQIEAEAQHAAAHPVTPETP